ncbi:MAG: LysR family transcriptional regulator [Methylobacteriaceae bacterium]|nr:LysR family transcriptional regulator [Methylobacteriaceae bacterium]
MDWDRIRVFYAVAEAGSLTQGGEHLGLSQSAVSRQIAALERDLNVPLFHRHTRGLILTEQGELLFRTAREIHKRLDTVQARLTDNKERPSGLLKVTTTVALGSIWLSRRIPEFMELCPDVHIELLLDDRELDLTMREADIGIRLRRPEQANLIQRRLFSIHFQIYASVDYLRRFGKPKTVEDLDNHRLLAVGGDAPSYLSGVHILATVGRKGQPPRPYHLTVNNLSALKSAVEDGAGIALLPDYVSEGSSNLKPVIVHEMETPFLDTYLVYAEEMRSVARVQAFREFLISSSQRWSH